VEKKKRGAEKGEVLFSPSLPLPLSLPLSLSVALGFAVESYGESSVGEREKEEIMERERVGAC
jgi:hypothetical protein